MTRKSPERRARRDAELSRMSNRVDYVPMYQDYYDGRGVRVKATYEGHRQVLARGIRYGGEPLGVLGFNSLAASISKLDLSRASEKQQRDFARAA